uniref:Dynein assembly factor 1, axonemal homolog n=1 Tax=Mantoniella antarctica TaxID=81844 RepID=A0A7S0XG64_9CHLO|mmetsp:Transcript_4330/g.10616  ORF Transcript_4330/g.10616 Transcript_4330/m.10616 type:complete len:512 (+) Transcript_4330:70-1605(+)
MAAWEMTRAALRKICLNNNGYAHAPELNDVLHLHCKGIAEVTNLEEYTGLKAIYLESNSVEELDGLLHLQQLKCLYMSKNCLFGLDGATSLAALTALDVSDNRIESLEGLRGHASITTLIAYGNKIKSVDGIDALRECPRLATLDLSTNKMAERSCVDFLIDTMGGQLSLLKLQGNPLVSDVPSYRKTVVCGFKHLNYLDDMPVFPKDRRLAEAWRRGGVEEEKAERARCFADEKAERERQRDRFNDMVAAARVDAEAKLAAGVLPDPELRYQFMSEEAKAEAKMLYEGGVAEWEMDELRNKEQLPWQKKERETKKAAKGAAGKAAGAMAAVTLTELAMKEEEQGVSAEVAAAAQKENVGFNANNVEDALALPVAMMCDESFDTGEDVPVAIPVEEDKGDEPDRVERENGEAAKERKEREDEQDQEEEDHSGAPDGVSADDKEVVAGVGLPPPPPPPPTHRNRQRLPTQHRPRRRVPRRRQRRRRSGAQRTCGAWWRSPRRHWLPGLAFDS